MCLECGLSQAAERGRELVGRSFAGVDEFVDGMEGRFDDAPELGQFLF